VNIMSRTALPELADITKDSGSKETYLRIVRRVAAFELSISALGDAASALDVSPTPQGARSVQATVNLIRSVEHKYGLLTPADAGVALGSVSKSSRNLAASRHRSGELIAIAYRGKSVYPGFQFTVGHEAVAAIKTLRTMAESNEWSEYDLFLWLVTPRGRLDGAIPADLLGTPGGEADVIRAAALEMQTDW
jgi:hypothetical protein